MALASLPAWQRAGRVVPRARRHVGRAHTADRHCGHGAQAVDRALALRRDGGGTGWRRDPGGDNSRRIERQELPPAAVAGGDTGSATVFVFGGTTPPRFRTTKTASRPSQPDHGQRSYHSQENQTIRPASVQKMVASSTTRNYVCFVHLVTTSLRYCWLIFSLTRSIKLASSFARSDWLSILVNGILNISS